MNREEMTNRVRSLVEQSKVEFARLQTAFGDRPLYALRFTSGLYTAAAQVEVYQNLLVMLLDRRSRSHMRTTLRARRQEILSNSRATDAVQLVCNQTELVSLLRAEELVAELSR